EAPMPEAPPVMRTVLSWRLGYRANVSLLAISLLLNVLRPILQVSLHGVFHQPREQLVELDHGVHEAGHDHFPLILEIPLQRSLRHAFDGDAARGFRAHGLVVLAFDRVGSEVRSEEHTSELQSL